VRLDDGEGLIAAAKLDLGLIQIPDYMIDDELARGELVELLPSCRPQPAPISAVHPAGRLVPARVRVLLEALRSLARRDRPSA
jgi:DNA-binding transcriptional LysR family regulator